MAEKERRGYENPGIVPPRVPGWRSFLKREAFFRHKYHSLVPGHPCVDIMHGDLECRYTHPAVDGYTVSYLNYPWLRSNRESTPAHYRVLTTDLRESDVVSGALHKAKEQLALAIEAMPSEAFVLLNSACVPDVTGEDLAQVARPWDGKAAVFYERSDGKDKSPPLVAKMVELSAANNGGKRGAADARRKKGTVNLVGYPPGRSEGELTALLAEAGVSVGACIVPSLSPAKIRAARTAGFHAVLPNKLYEGLYREVLGAAPLPALRPPPPYGMSGTGRWLDAVAAAASAGGKGRLFSRLRGRWGARWSALRREAATRRLGFVLDPAELPILSEPALNAGCPVVPMLKEMGFGLDFLMYDPRGAFAEHRGKHRMHSFGSPDELATKLGELSCGAFYSDCFFDTRLTRSGKGQFSLASFEAGVQGAVRTLERLLGVCRMPFYRRYGRYLTGGADR